MSITNRLERIESRRGGDESRFYPYMKWERGCFVLRLKNDGIPSLEKRNALRPEPKKPRGYDAWAAERAKVIAGMLPSTDDLMALVKSNIARAGAEPNQTAEVPPLTMLEGDKSLPAPVDRLRGYRDDPGNVLKEDHD